MSYNNRRILIDKSIFKYAIAFLGFKLELTCLKGLPLLQNKVRE